MPEKVKQKSDADCKALADKIRNTAEALNKLLGAAASKEYDGVTAHAEVQVLKCAEAGDELARQVVIKISRTTDL